MTKDHTTKQRSCQEAAGARQSVKPFSIAMAFERCVTSLQLRLEQLVNAQLAATIDQLLGRHSHARRARLAPWIEGGVCVRCGTRRSSRFCRNGTRARVLLTPWGLLRLRLPRAVCHCGGSVRLDFGAWLRPYQRLSNEVEAQIQRWGTLCLSLRQMQTELQHTFIGGLGLRTLLERLHRLSQSAPSAADLHTPPVLQLDAIWVTQLRPNGQVRIDAKGRRRAVKGRFKRPLLLALGLWPDTDHVELLAWQLGQDESAATWLAFLTDLEERGIRGQNGLRLLIHDGGSGLCAALHDVFFDAAQQRCLFHKLRNIRDALDLPASLSATQRRRRRRAILKEFRAIWEAKQYATTLRRYLQVVRTYRHTQPQAVAVLRQDFRLTLTYFDMERAYPTWPRAFLRTTSHLERFNQSLRAHFDAARAYHSDAGILAVVALETMRRTGTYL